MIIIRQNGTSVVLVWQKGLGYGWVRTYYSSPVFTHRYTSPTVIGTDWYYINTALTGAVHTHLLAVYTHYLWIPIDVPFIHFKISILSSSRSFKPNPLQCLNTCAATVNYIASVSQHQCSNCQLHRLGQILSITSDRVRQILLPFWQYRPKNYSQYC